MSPAFDPLDPATAGAAPACAAFEIALGMRARGALPPRATAQLAAHLPGCAACRTFADQLVRLDAALAAHAAAAAASPPPDWEAIRARMRSQAARYTRRMPWLMVGACAAGIAIYAGLHALLIARPLAARTVAMAMVWVVPFLAAIYLWNVRYARRLVAQADVVAAYRSDLARTLGRLRFVRWWLPAMALFAAARAALALPDALAGDGRAQFALALNGLFAVTLALPAWVTGPSIQRTRRALEALK
jgi:hypothetical protein